MKLPLWRRKQKEELEEELRAHLDAAIRERIECGASREEAEAGARREFGNVNLVREATRDMWGWLALDHLAQDIRYGWRQLRHSPGFTIVAVLTLALGIGANTTLFSVVDAVLLKTLPVKEPERLVLFEYRAGLPFRISGMSGTSFVSDDPSFEADSLFRYEVFDRMRQAHQAAPHSPLSDLFAFAPLGEINCVVSGQAEVIGGQVVSGEYFRGLGAQPMLGRSITEQDDKAGAAPVVVLNHLFWMERFKGNPGILGQTLQLNQQRFTIVGVMPPGFRGALQVDYHPAFSVPLATEPLLRGENSALGLPSRPGFWWLDVMGRLQPGATLEEASAILGAPFQAAALELMPPPRRADEPARLHPKDYPQLMAESGSRGMLDERRMHSPTIYGLFLVVVLVLLIACANIANLQLARTASRKGEMTVRLAIGAGRARLMRQVLTESLLLGGLGGVGGVLLAVWGNSVLLALSETSALTQASARLVPGNIELRVSWRVLAFTLVVSCLTGVLFGLAPAWRAAKLDLAAALKQTRRSARAVSRLAQGLIVTQVAASLLLLVGAGLLIRTLQNLQQLNLGFNQENLLVFRLRPGNAGYAGDRLLQFYQQLFARLDHLPGVRAATFGQVALLGGDNYYSGILLPGELEENARRRSTARQIVRQNYFATLEIPSLRGRGFTPQDDARAPQVAIVNQAFSREFFPNSDVLGQRITFRRGNRSVEIVGVVADAKYRSQREEIRSVLFTPWQQEIAAIGEMNFILRTMGETTALAPAVQQIVRGLDNNVPLAAIGTQAARSQATLGPERLSARLLGFFGGLALVLASVGLYGILAYSVAQRTQEIGIRMALGAPSSNVLRRVIGQGMKLVVLGLAAGVTITFGLQRLVDMNFFGQGFLQTRMAEQLYGVRVTDPLTLVAIAGLLLSVGLLACWLPARRASRVDPLFALRHE